MTDSDGETGNTTSRRGVDATLGDSLMVSSSESPLMVDPVSSKGVIPRGRRDGDDMPNSCSI